MLLGFVSLKSVLIILHLIGVALGAGGAYISDFMFVQSVRDEVFNKTEVTFLNLASTMIWIGIITLIVSGIGLFVLDPAKYLFSTKFLAKMTVVTIITLNGLVFYKYHSKLLHRHSGIYLPSSKEFVRIRPYLLISGAISLVSWTSAIILGAFKLVPYSYSTIMSTYFVITIIAIFITLVLGKLTFHKLK